MADENGVSTPSETGVSTPIETDKKIITPSETDKKIITPIETDKKIITPSETDKKIISPIETDKKIITLTETDKKIITPSETDKKIIKQIEYYFGDINLVKDKFLKEIMKEDDGWVTMETMLKFKRLLQISEDPAVIANALKKSTSGLVEVSEDGLKIRRNPEKTLPELTMERKNDLSSRSIYAKGFPVDMELDKLIEFFSTFGETEHVQQRRALDKSFKGSCFVVYASSEGAKKFIDTEDVKFEETTLIKYTKQGYFKMKEEEKKQFKAEQSKKVDEKEQQKAEEEQNKLKDVTLGAILHMSNIPPDTTREDIKELFEPYGAICWVEFDRGDKEGRLRFEESGGAEKGLNGVKEANDGKVPLKDAEIECRVLEGDEEMEHWKKVFQQQKERRNRSRFGGGGRGGGGRGGGRGGGGRGGRGGRGGYRGRGRGGRHSHRPERSDDGPPAKQAKLE